MNDLPLYCSIVMKPLSDHGWTLLEMAKLPFLGKGSFNEDRLGLFLLLLLLDSNFLSGRRKQSLVPKKSTYEKEREKKKSNARKQLLKLSHGKISLWKRGQLPVLAVPGKLHHGQATQGIAFYCLFGCRLTETQLHK